jgi:HEAT repeat protein
MCGKIRLLVAPVLAVSAGLIVAPTACAQSRPPSLERLFEQALVAKGDEYIELRNQIAARKDEVSFLKARLSDKDWKTAIIAEAIFGRITEPRRYAAYEAFLVHLVDQINRSESIVGPVRQIRPLAKWLPQYRKELREEYRGSPQINAGLDEMAKDRAVPFLVEVAIKNAVRYSDYPRLGYSDEFLDKYFRRYFNESLYFDSLRDPSKKVEGIEKLTPKEHEELCRILEIREQDEWNRLLFRFYATIRLGSFTHPPAQAALVLLSSDYYVLIRASAVEGLEQTMGLAGAPHLRAALHDEHAMVQVAAARALGRLSDAEAVDALIDTLQDENPVLRETVAVALAQIGDVRATKPLIETFRTCRAEDIAVSIGKIDFQALLDLLDLKDTDSNLSVIRVAMALGVLKDARAVPRLLVLLDDEDWRVRTASARALGKIADRRAAEPLIDALQGDVQADVRSTAAEALGRLKDPRAVEPLINALNDKAHYVRENAVNALYEIADPRALKALEAAAEHDDNASVRRQAKLAARKIRKDNRRK